MGDPFLNYFALFLLIFVVVVLFYGIIAIHDIPAKIAESRHHPHQDAIHAAGWVSLFTLHALWPFLWIYAVENTMGLGNDPGTGDTVRVPVPCAAARSSGTRPWSPASLARRPGGHGSDAVCRRNTVRRLCATDATPRDVRVR